MEFLGRSISARKLGLLGTAAALVVFSTTHAGATFYTNLLPQEDTLPANVPGYNLEPTTKIESRPHPEYTPQPIRVGSFLINTGIQESVGFVSNPIGTPHGPSSPVVETSPFLTFNSDWNRNSIGGAISVEDVRYTDLPQQSYTNDTVSLGGTYQIGLDTLTISASHLDDTVLPTAVGTTRQLVPTPYHVEDIRLNYLTTFGRLSVQPTLSFTNYDFDLVRANLVNGGTNSVDRNVYEGGVNFSYALTPERNLLAVVRGTRQDYYGDRPVGLRTLTSNGSFALVGLRDTLGPISFYVLVGYQTRDFISRAYQNRTAPVAEAAVSWSPTLMTTATFTLQRAIEDSLTSNSLGYTYNRAKFEIDHELQRNIVLTGQVEYDQADQFQSPQVQDIVQAGGKISYLLNRHVRLGLSYAYSTRHDDTFAANNYDQHTILASATFNP